MDESTWILKIPAVTATVWLDLYSERYLLPHRLCSDNSKLDGIPSLDVLMSGLIIFLVKEYRLIYESSCSNYSYFWGSSCFHLFIQPNLSSDIHLAHYNERFFATELQISFVCSNHFIVLKSFHIHYRVLTSIINLSWKFLLYDQIRFC